MFTFIRKWKEEGVPLRALNRGFVGLAIVLTVLMVISIVQSFLAFETLQEVSNRHNALRISSYELQIASDYLTEQARCFAVCGEREHLDNYFEEANVTCRRDRALETVQAQLGDTQPYQALRKAMSQSVHLMDTEYYSMRLAVEARHDDLSTYPEVIRALQLTAEDLALSDEKKEEKARNLVFDDNYHNQKKIISENTQACLQDLDQIMSDQEAEADRKMTRVLWQMGITMGLLILCMLANLMLNSRLLIRPILQAVEKIQQNRLLEDNGAHEFRYLARTYNQVYDMNQEQAERLAYEASHDKLTGLSNRNSFDMVMAKMKDQHHALLLLDVDFFKRINDNEGHHAGDQALRRVGRIIRSNFREQDYVFRVGGDEFAVIMQHVTTEHSEKIAEKIKSLNEKLSTLEKQEDESLKTTVSVGVAFCTGNETPDLLYRQADKALYEAKGKGRQCCCFYQEA